MNDVERLAVSKLAEHVGGQVFGDGALLIGRIAALEAAGEGEIAYVEDEKFFEAAKSSRATCLLVPKAFPSFASRSPDVQSPTFVEVARPKLAFALIAKLLHPPKHREPGIHPTAIIASTADVALTAFIGPHACVGEDAR